MSDLNNEMLAAIREIIKEENSKLHARLDSLDKNVAETREVADKALTASRVNQENIATLEESTTTDHNDLQEQIDKLKTELDDVRNRSMRGNLVFYGIKEEENDDPQQRVTTKDLVASFLVKFCNVQSRETAHNYLVRVHRSRNNEKNRRQTPRPIFAKFSRDDVADMFLRACIEQKVTDHGYKVTKQFTPQLQVRRNEAMQLRRELLQRKEIEKGYVDYPAVLKCVKTGDRHYTTIETF